MNTTFLFRHALVGLTLAASLASASATVVYNETFGNTEVSNPTQTFDLQPYMTASGVTYSEYSTAPVWSSLTLQQTWATNQDPSYTFPNIAPDANLTIGRIGGGLAVSGIDTSAFIGQSLTLELSTLIGWRANNNANGSAALYPFVEGSGNTERTMLGDFNDFVKFEMSNDGGLNWSTLTFSLTMNPVDITRPWTQWEADLGSVSGTELQLRFQDTGLLATTNAYNPDNGGIYTNGIRIDSLSITAAVPEPSAFALAAGACALLYVSFRRRRRSTNQE